MTVLERRWAFMACAAALVSAAALVAALKPSPSSDDAKSAARAHPVVLANADTRNSGPPHRNYAGLRTPATKEHDSLAAARQSARAFVRVFLRYQFGDMSPRAHAGLARTASAAVQRYLVATRARHVRDAPHPEFQSMRLYALGRTKVKASALLRYGRRQSLFEFLLERGHVGWRVAELYP